jgi:hypothetical protein
LKYHYQLSYNISISHSFISNFKHSFKMKSFTIATLIAIAFAAPVELVTRDPQFGLLGGVGGLLGNVVGGVATLPLSLGAGLAGGAVDGVLGGLTGGWLRDVQVDSVRNKLSTTR